jgi:hypothetical protein
MWQKRFYDFNVWTEEKQIEKLRYMHRNPVRRGLVDRPEQWEWSSFRFYLFGETGLVRVKFQVWPMEIKRRPVATFGEGNVRASLLFAEAHSFAKNANECGRFRRANPTGTVAAS